MHRTQIMLKQAQQRFLRGEERRLGVRMGGVRRLAARDMPGARGEPADLFEAVAGIVATGGGLPVEE